MKNKIEMISQIPCISGSEWNLAQYLYKHFLELGFKTTKFPANHVLIQTHDATEHPDTVIFTPMDCPGFICLYKEDGEAYLSGTSQAFAEIDDFDEVVRTDGKKFSLEKSKFDEKSFSIKSDNVKIGDAFTTPTFIEKIQDEDGFKGRFSSRFACISILQKLAESLTNPKVAICFTSGFHSVTKAETNILNRIQGRNVVLLGFSNQDGLSSNPIIAIKDGKFFSSRLLADKLTNACKKNTIQLDSAVLDQAATAAERVFSQSVEEILSLVLPCQNPFQKNEKVFGAEKMLSALTLLIQTIE